jgi:predicted esterase
VSVELSRDSLAFVPAKGAGRALIFYPGARVPPEAYAYLGRALAERGHLVAIARFPLDFAIFAPSRAATIMRKFAGVDSWVLGGHSLGGAIAASWLHSHPGAADGLLLLASWPPVSADFSARSLPVLSLSASNDGLATPAKLALSRALLPSAARFVVIEGGNHAGFGEYGAQKGDGTATIDAGRQRAAVVAETLSFLESAP